MRGSVGCALQRSGRSARNIAGRVAAVGLGVTGFAVGDEVYGDNLALKGGFAEFAVAPASALAHKPEALSFVQASALPQAAAIATQGTTRVQSGQRVLINGAGGGSGSFAIQLAKQAGAHVTGVDNARKLDFMRSLGADEAVDYEQEDFSRLPAFDHVLDLVAHRSVFAYRRALAPREVATAAWAARSPRCCACSPPVPWSAPCPDAASVCSP